MTLPSPIQGNVRWTDYRIDTPTFRLTPIEKPDMSPFLFHMTGMTGIKSILSGEGGVVEPGHGFLKACVPESNRQEGGYDAEVVCLTESPTFALDFFRYRSFRRWKDDQRYGIGFDKSELIALGARPCVYADDKLKNDIIILKKYIETNEIKDEAIKGRLVSLLNSLYPLTNPISEASPLQGFMWEREWRYFDHASSGFVFPHGSIRLICCPQPEEGGIREILGDVAEGVRFVRTWTEYDEVTAYMRQRRQVMFVPTEAMLKDADDLVDSLKEQIEKHSVTLHSLEQYSEFIDSLGVKNNSVATASNELREVVAQMEKKIEQLHAKKKES